MLSFKHGELSETINVILLHVRDEHVICVITVLYATILSHALSKLGMENLDGNEVA